jgi:Domain of unknown function (DUF222)
MFDTVQCEEATADARPGLLVAGVLAGGVIPAGLETMPPGPGLGAVLAGIDVSTLSGHDRVVVLGAQQRMVSHHEAALYRTMASVVDAVAEVDGIDDRVEAAELAASEVRAGLRLTRRAADFEVLTALALTRRLSRVLAKLDAGVLDVRRVRVFDAETGHLDDAATSVVVDGLVDEAYRFTTGQLAARIRKLAIETEPEAVKAAFEHALEARRVVVEATGFGTVDPMGCDLAPDVVAAIRHRIDRLARTLAGPGEARTMDQLRSDVLTGLLSGKAIADAASSTSTSTWRPSPSCLRRQVSWPATGPSSPTSPATSPTPNTTRNGATPSPTPTRVSPSPQAPPADAPTPTSGASSRPATPSVSSPAAAHRPRHATSTTASATKAGTTRPTAHGDHEWTSPLGHTHTISGRPP